MSISISGQHVELSADLKEYVTSKLAEAIDKYIGSDIRSVVHFGKSNHYHLHCGIVIHEGIGKHHHVIRSDADSDELYASFDMAFGKVLKQLRKYKSKLKNNHHKTKLAESTEAKKYIINPSYIDDNRHDSEHIDIVANHSVIIAEHDYEIMTLKVSEAVMKMDLEDVPAVIFKNSSSKHVNMVYRKRDGNIVWVDSKEIV